MLYSPEKRKRIEKIVLASKTRRNCTVKFILRLCSHREIPLLGVDLRYYLLVCICPVEIDIRIIEHDDSHFYTERFRTFSCGEKSYLTRNKLHLCYRAADGGKLFFFL